MHFLLRKNKPPSEVADFLPFCIAIKDNAFSRSKADIEAIYSMYARTISIIYLCTYYHHIYKKEPSGNYAY